MLLKDQIEHLTVDHQSLQVEKQRLESTVRILIVYDSSFILLDKSYIYIFFFCILLTVERIR